jgi:predicted Fe-Mo cluster-binding NifX family protein
MVPMIIAVNVVGGLVGSGLGRAATIAVADVEDSQIRSWEEYEVRWDLSHDQPAQPLTVGTRPDASHGSHHARIVSFMKEHGVQVVVTGHVGPPMAHTLDLMGITVVTGAIGDAKQAALDAAQMVTAS